jgi:hypothetical protein
MKTAVVVLSDPKAGEEALGRVFNALAAALDFKSRKQDVVVLFQGAGTRWASALEDPAHPVHGLYKAVEDKVAGVSAGCAVVFGAHDGAEAAGHDFLSDNPVPGTAGLPSLARYAAEGYQILTF